MHIIENWKEFNKEEELDFIYNSHSRGLWRPVSKNVVLLVVVVVLVVFIILYQMISDI